MPTVSGGGATGANEPDRRLITNQRRNYYEHDDPIADMLTRVRNANSAGKPTVSMPSSKKLVEIARIMQEEGYVAGYEVAKASPALRSRSR